MVDAIAHCLLLLMQSSLCTKTVKKTAILCTTTTLKNKFAHKNIGITKTKLNLRKHKNGNTWDNKRKSERDYTKKHKMPRHNVKNNNYEKLKHLRRNKHFFIP